MDIDRELQQVNIDELKAMLIFLDIKVFNRENLKTSVRELLKVNHVDKGGDLAINQQITRANRILTACLDHNYVIPGYSPASSKKPPPDTSRGSFFDHYNYASKATDDWSSYGKLFRTKKKQNMKFSHKNKFQSFFEESEEDEDGMFDKEAARARSRPKCYNNNYDYDSSDEFWPNDKQEYSKKDSGADDHRCVRGGLALRKPFSGIGLPEAYVHLAESEFNVSELKKEELETNPKLAYLLPLLTGFSKKPSFGTLIERTQAFVYLDWVVAEQSNCTPYTNVNLRSRPGGAVQIYLKQVEEDDIVDDRLKEGAIIQIHSPEDPTLNAKAVVDSVDFENHTIIVKFNSESSGQRILESGMQVNISMAPGAFIYKAFMRGINEILNRKMDKFVFPQPEFGITVEDYNTFSDQRIQRDKMTADAQAANDDEPSSSTAIMKPDATGFNLLQRQAIDTIVHDACGPHPFVLFGPPGTGKTATLVEAVHRITKLGKEKRILVCATSNMAADVIALTILKQKFIHPKYVFRLNSLSGDVKARNYKLDPVTCVVKGRDAGYGIPCLRNLQVFRIVVTTLTASAYLNMAGGLRGYFSHIFVDEAGQATEQETWIPIGGLAISGVTKIALFGDHKQLGAVDSVPVLREYGYATSMLERLMSLPAYKSNDRRLMVMLEQNYRSHELILRPASMLFYDKRLLSNKEDPQLYGMCGWSKLQNPSFPLIFHSIRGSRERRSHTHSYMNTHEINTCLDYVNELRKYNVPPSDIGIISPYRCQAAELKSVLNGYDKTYTAIAVNSVEGFQGSERRVIILLTTRSNALGFLYCDKRLNTSITRARELLIVLGDEHLLSQHINWKKLINYVKNHDGFIPSKLMREEFDAYKAKQAEKVAVAIEGIKLEGTEAGVKPPPGFESFANDDDDDFADPVVPEPVSPPRMSTFQFSSNAGGNVPLTEIFSAKLPNSTPPQNREAVPKPPERTPRFTTRLPSQEVDESPKEVRTACLDPRIKQYDNLGDIPAFTPVADADDYENRRPQTEDYGRADGDGYQRRQEEAFDGGHDRVDRQYESYRGGRNAYDDGYTRDGGRYDNYGRSEGRYDGYGQRNNDYEGNRGEQGWNRDTRRDAYDDRDNRYRETRRNGYDDYHREHYDSNYRGGDDYRRDRGEFNHRGGDDYHRGGGEYQRERYESNQRGRNYREADYNTGHTDYSRGRAADYERHHDDRDRRHYDEYSRDYARQDEGRRSQHRDGYAYDDHSRRYEDSYRRDDYAYSEAYPDQTQQYDQYNSHGYNDGGRYRDDCNYSEGFEGQQRDDHGTGRDSRCNEESRASVNRESDVSYVPRRTPTRDDAVGNYCFDSSFEEEQQLGQQPVDEVAVIHVEPEPTDDVLESSIDVTEPEIVEEVLLSLQSIDNALDDFTNNDLDAINRFCELKASEESWMF
uniref:RNA helicase n=1 Tax=Panagrellus redivivus TaxID=6233 RepID=A0A7E4UPN3_PANRE